MSDALARTTPGPYQLQAAIAAVHDEAERAEDTDWAQILALYAVLERIAPNPMVTLNHAVALAMVARAAGRSRAARHAGRRPARRRAPSPRGGPGAPARAGRRARTPRATAYRAAARRTTSIPEQRYLEVRAARLGDG